MQSIIDATCRDCGQVIRWDTALPRLCNVCWDALRKPSATPEDEPQDESESEEVVA